MKGDFNFNNSNFDKAKSKEEYLMLQFMAKKVDICKLGKILLRYNIQAEISSDKITILGDIDEKAISAIIENTKITNFFNYKEEESSGTKANVESKNGTDLEIIGNTTLVTEQIKEYDVIYDSPKRGDVYYCDLGIGYKKEQGGLRPVIVIQNDTGNKYSPTTIILPLTSEIKNVIPTHYSFFFSDDNVDKYNADAKKLKLKNTTLAEQIRVIDKSRLRSYICTMNFDFMGKIDELICSSLNIENTISKDINLTQVQLLGLIDVKELLAISTDKSITQLQKIRSILKLFGFKEVSEGIDYLEKAILIAPKCEYYNMEFICNALSKEKDIHIDKDEINHRIVLRVRENFNFEKAPTIDFIRLINIFMIK